MYFEIRKNKKKSLLVRYVHPLWSSHLVRIANKAATFKRARIHKCVAVEQTNWRWVVEVVEQRRRLAPQCTNLRALFVKLHAHNVLFVFGLFVIVKRVAEASLVA
jgi:hypothetical protein